MSTNYISTHGMIWGEISDAGVPRSYGHDALGSVIETYVGGALQNTYRYKPYGGSLAKAFIGSKTRFCVVSFSSDWLYPTSASRAIVHALNAGGASVSFVDIATDRGHDAFLLDDPEFSATARGFLDGAARARGLPPPANSMVP